MTDGLNKAINRAGNQEKLAEILEVTPATVSQWKLGQRPIPVERVYEIRRAFPEITLHELRPDIYRE